jgi:hypothetical protein
MDLVRRTYARLDLENCLQGGLRTLRIWAEWARLSRSVCSPSNDVSSPSCGSNPAYVGSAV